MVIGGCPAATKLPGADPAPAEFVFESEFPGPLPPAGDVPELSESEDEGDELAGEPLPAPLPVLLDEDAPPPELPEEDEPLPKSSPDPSVMPLDGIPPLPAALFPESDSPESPPGGTPAGVSAATLPFVGAGVREEVDPPKLGGGVSGKA